MRRVLPSLPSRPRREGVLPTTVVLHATAVDSVTETLWVLRDRGLSYHFLIDRDGTVLQLVNPAEVAFHCGESLGPEGPAVNEYSLGISLVNLNDGVDPYPAEQRAALVALIQGLSLDSLRSLTTHAVIAPTRKTDPFGFDAATVAEEVGLSFWSGVE
jgi:N-acetylmuramoyl-L-alanine amidase